MEAVLLVENVALTVVDDAVEHFLIAAVDFSCLFALVFRRYLVELQPITR